MKKRFLATVLAFLTFVFFALSGCESNEDIYKNKKCVKCDKQATHFVSGTKPTNANENNSQQINGTVYRIFYCEKCWENVPKVELKP